MTGLSMRRSLALSATLATTAALGGVMSAAHATNPTASTGYPQLSVFNDSDLIYSNGGVITGFGQLGASSHELSWSANGSGFAYVNGNGDIVVGSASMADDQLRNIITPANTTGVIRSHPVWIDGGASVLWSERASATSPAVLKFALANGYDKDPATGAQIVHDFVPTAGIAGSFEAPDAVNLPGGDLLAVQYTAATSGSTPSIMIIDPAAPAGQDRYVVAQGVSPTLSSDGTTVAFIAPDSSGIDQIHTVPTSNPGATTKKPTPVTAATAPNTHSYSNPVWSPDGSSIFFEALDSTGKATDTKRVTLGSNTETPLSAHPVTGFLSFRPFQQSTITRLAGGDRLDTAEKVSQSHWADASAATGVKAKVVVLSRSDTFADALGGSALAAKMGGPLLLTPTAALDQQALTEIQRVLGPGDGAKTVYLLGGTAALSPQVESALTTLNYHVQRVQGPDRYSTAVQIANTITGGKAPDVVFAATGDNFADALSAGAAAGAADAGGGRNAVIVLTHDKAMPQATASYLLPLALRTAPGATGHVTVEAVGGQAKAALDSQWTPAGIPVVQYGALVGADRYATSLLVAKTFFGPNGTVGFATGLNWADALSGGALMGTVGGPVILTAPGASLLNPTSSERPQGDWLMRSSSALHDAYVFGGPMALPTTIEDEMVQVLPAAYGNVTTRKVLNPHA